MSLCREGFLHRDLCLYGSGPQCAPGLEEYCNETGGIWYDWPTCQCGYDNGCDDSGRYDCEAEGHEWNETECLCEWREPGPPIVIDMEGNGYRLTDAAHGVSFDLTADGRAELLSWTAPDSDDAWLAMDRDGNGKIDSGAELFGNHTPLRVNGYGGRATNGFEALRSTEQPDYGQSVQDSVIDARDAVWNRLLLWTDRNHNGISEPGELRPVSQSAIKSIDTRARESRRRDPFGNEFLLRAKAAFEKANGKGTTERFVYDVWLKAY